MAGEPAGLGVAGEARGPDSKAVPRIVIIGGGFGGLAVAQGLSRSKAEITLIDRRNHHLFQPLLYQVATAALSPAQIAAPIRQVVRKQSNCRVLLAEATGVDMERRVVKLADGELPYDTLVVAAGATHSYFGHDEWAEHAPGLKCIEDALEIRRRFFLAFERAERQTDAAERAAELTFVIVGAGPTGVEMAGAMVEIALKTIPQDFRRADTTQAKVILVEAQPRVLPTGFPAEAAGRALDDLRRMGVDVRLRSRVTEINALGVTLVSSTGAEFVATRNVLWAAGVAASPLGTSLGAPLDSAGRVIVEPDLTVPGHPEIFVIGDLAYVMDRTKGAPVPGMCPAAMQMGRYVAEIVEEELARGPVCGRVMRPAFIYRDKGLLATIGRARAVAYMGGRTFSGFAAWALWAAVHIVFLITFRAKLLVLVDWVWAYLFFERGARLITGEKPSERMSRRPQETNGNS